ncbi:MAG: penicillin acylase family protein [Chloroflexi bacterium]|nr:penicillin acylase family protein [Chloroflexota bacterium]
MKKAGKVLGRILTVIVIIAIVLGAGGAFYLKSYIPNTVAEKSFPQIDGELKVSGLDAAVDIYRDKMGIPHVYATTTHDLFFAQGYVHAQDRFWQMDFWRHIGSGRLSEMFGDGQVRTDSFLRTLGWREVAEQEYKMLNPESKALLDSYTEGVNAYIQERGPVELSLEYLILSGVLNPSYTIEPWTPVNSLTWGKAMAWDLGGNMDDEIERAILLKTLTPEQLSDLYPDYPADYPVIVPTIGENVSNVESQKSKAADFQLSSLNLQPIAEKLALMQIALGPTGPDIGSNSWVVSGDLTTTGKPILANDMHLGIQMPSIWYQNALHCLPKSDACPFEITGFSFAGVPGVVAGHNDRIAWAYTNLGPDVEDLFIEKVNPENPNQYEVEGKWVDFEIRKETINVGGGDPVELNVRITRHGPVISDTYGSLKDNVTPTAQAFKDKVGVDLPENYVIALQWTALTPSTPFEAIWGFNKATNWEEFRIAARNFHVPAQNLLYADVDGNIGYQTPGDIPLRKNGDGTLPVPGWTGEYDWNGYIPFEELPYTFNPQSGYIATANNQANPRDYPYLITKDWDYGQRAARIVDMITSAPGKIDIAYIQSMHGDSKNLNAETLLPILLSVKLDPGLAAVRDQTLGTWDYQETINSKSASVFEWFWSNALTDTFQDDLPQAYLPGGGSRWYVVMRNLVQQPDSAWWDDKSTTDKVETRDDIFARAFAETVSQMEKEYGKDPAKWPKWGTLHTSTFRNATLGESGIGPIEELFNRGPFVTGGGKSVVNATGWTVGVSFEVDWLPSEREIVDLSNLDNSLAGHTTGQSGHAYHPHYDDMALMWTKIGYAPMWWEQASVIKDSEGHLKLIP